MKTISYLMTNCKWMVLLFSFLLVPGYVRAEAPVANNQTNHIPVLSKRVPIGGLSYTDRDGGTMSFTLLSAPTNGTLEYRASDYTSLPVGVPVNVPHWYYSSSQINTGNDIFTWQVSDGTATSGVATVTVNLTSNNAPIANGGTQDLAVGTVRKSLYPSITHPDSYQPMTYIVTGTPTNGIVEYKDGTNYVSIPLNTPFTRDLMTQTPWYYTPSTGYVGGDSIKWKISDGIATSAVATYTLNVTSNTAPTANSIRASGLPESSLTVNASYKDPDAAQTWTASVVGNALNGNVTVSYGVMFTYTPNPGFRGLDRFTYKVNDQLDDSNIATGIINIRAANERSSNLVILVVNDILRPAISNEVDRLKQDLENEGYTSKIRDWHLSGSNSSNLWTYLRGEYDNTNQFLEGAILIGDVPKAQTRRGDGWFYTDLPYWNMSDYQTSGKITTRHIWVTRMNADDTSWGTQDVLIKRALRANHEYRTGISRLPFNAYVFNCFDTEPETNTMLETWPAVYSGGGGDHNASFEFLPSRTDINHAACDAFVAGGEVFNETSHGNSEFYMEGRHFYKPALYRLIAQQRAGLIGSCSSGAFGGIANNHIFTRGGGLVLAVGGTGLNYSGDFVINSSAYHQTQFRARLKAGDTWGGACLYSYPFTEHMSESMTVFFGDFSMRVMPSGSNEIPVITSLVASPAAPRTGQPVSFAIAVSDPDSAATNSPYVDFKHQVEWFMDGYNYGRNNPNYTTNDNDIAWTNQTHVFAAAGTYVVRVEVMDEWKARGWKELTLTVNTPPVASNDSVSVVAGRSTVISVLANDGDAEGQALTIQSCTKPPKGTTAVSGSTIVYTSTNYWEGPDVFTYTVRDTYSATAVATVTVSVCRDETPPAISSVSCGASNIVRVLFSKVLDPVTAGNPANYTLDQGATVQYAALGRDGRTVTLGVANLAEGVLYRLAVSGINDDVPFVPNTTEPGNSMQFICRVVDAKKMKITLAGYNRPEPLTNFPVLVVFNESIPGFSYSQFLDANGGDLRMYTADEGMELYYEIEQWKTNGDSCVWVQVPVLTNGAVLCARWGDAGLASRPAYATNGAAWDSKFRGVWHLAESAGTNRDSTVNGNHGIRNGNVYAAAGSAGAAQLFAGSAFVDCGNQASLLIQSNLTLSVWINPTNLSGERGLASKWGSSWCWSLNHDGSDVPGRQGIYFSGWKTASNAVSTGVWSHVAMVYDRPGKKIDFYLNGVHDGSVSETSVPGTGANLYIGQRQSGSYRFAGYMDEARVEATARSSNWIWASWLNVASNSLFCAVDPVQTLASAGRDAYGIPDAWTVFHFGATNVPGSGASEDADHDGMSNLKEYLSGTDPNSAKSRFGVSLLACEAQGMGLEFETIPGLAYHVYWKSNLLQVADWQLYTNFTSTGSLARVTYTNKENSGFLQIRVNP